LGLLTSLLLSGDVPQGDFSSPGTPFVILGGHFPQFAERVLDAIPWLTCERPWIPISLMERLMDWFLL
jgi:hypothetical protein